MLEWFNQTILALADPLFNGLLRLPMNLVLVIVAVGTGGIITYARRFTTNQDFLRRCADDKQRLKELMRAAKAGGDKQSLQRYRLTFNMISISTLRQEGWPLLVALLPIAILGTWCFQRLAFIPPKAGETVTIRAYFPVSAVGELAHLVPQPGVREVSGGNRAHWIQPIAADEVEQLVTVHATDQATGRAITRKEKQKKAVGGCATWQVQAEARGQPYPLEIHYQDQTARMELLVGQRQYTPDLVTFGAGKPIAGIHVLLRPVEFLGIVPGISALGIPPWMLAYFLIAIPSVTLIKRLGRIY
jgi:hypothetical protein